MGMVKLRRISLMAVLAGIIMYGSGCSKDKPDLLNKPIMLTSLPAVPVIGYTSGFSDYFDCISGSGLCNLQSEHSPEAKYELNFADVEQLVNGEWVLKIKIVSDIHHLENYLIISNLTEVPYEIANGLGYDQLIINSGEYMILNRNQPGESYVLVTLIDPTDTF
jgi:hypothetical protein